MLAMKVQSREAFQKAIDACAEASIIHLEAMAKEHYSILLNMENDATLAKDYITSSYWLYQDWGAHAKALQLSNQYEFLKVSEYCMFYIFVHYFMQSLSYVHSLNS